MRGDGFSNGFACDGFLGIVSEAFDDKVNSGVVGTEGAGLIAKSGGGDEMNGLGCISGVFSTAIELVKFLARTSPRRERNTTISYAYSTKLQSCS